MANNYLNTGVLGQVVGGTLSTASLGGAFRDFRAEVQSKKRTISGISQSEREATRKRRQDRIKAAEETTGTPVDTADVKVPEIPVDPTAPAPVQQEQAQQNIVSRSLGITKVEAAKPAPAPAPKAVAPERQYTDADVAFAQAFSSWSQTIGGKNDTDVRSGNAAAQASLQAVLDAAGKTGRKDVMSAVGSIQGILGQKHISARNVGQAKASTIAAGNSIRNVLDIDSILKSNPLAAAAPAANVTTTAMPQPTRVRRGRGFFYP